MSADHCAFCDQLIGAASRETVEHFKPKRDYPLEAYQWGNLYPCCDVCQASKGEKFEDKLLAPDMVDYAFERWFVFNFLTGEIEPSPATSEDDQARACSTIRLYGLNSAKRNRARLLELKRMTIDLETHSDDWNFRFLLDSSGIG